MNIYFHNMIRGTQKEDEKKKIGQIERESQGSNIIFLDLYIN